MCITTTQKDNDKSNTTKEYQGKKFTGLNQHLHRNVFK